MASPYTGIPIEQWEARTSELIKQHPLDLETIREVALASWGTLWLTKIGEGETAIPIAELDVPAMVVGYFFEKLFARELQRYFPDDWRGGRSKDEKDLVFLPDSFFSTEMKILDS
jgi:ScaI-like restriction endonuclease